MTNNSKRITKAKVGRPMDFQGSDGILNGRIVKVARGIATIEYYVPGLFTITPFTHYLPVNSPQIIEVY